MKKRKILFVGSFKPPLDGKIGGQYFACSSLMSSSLKDNFEFVLIDSTLDSIHVGHVVFRFNKIFKRVVRFLFNLWFSRIDVAFIFTSSGLSFIEKGFMCMVARISGKRVVLFPRSGALLKNAAGPLYRAYLRLVFRSCHRVVCQSEFWKNSFARLAPSVSSNRFLVVENWLNDTFFQYFPGTKKTPLLDQSLRILYFNRIERDKGIYDFLEAVRLLKTNKVSVRADIYGDGREIENVKTYLTSNELSDVTFKGWLERKMETIPIYDVYVFTSHSEGFPNALLEVMASGVAIVSTNVGAVPDLIVDGINGFVVPVGDPGSIAKAIEKIDQNRELVPQFATRSYSRVSERNRLSVAVQQLQELLQNV